MGTSDYPTYGAGCGSRTRGAGGQCRFTGSPLTDSLALWPGGAPAPVCGDDGEKSSRHCEEGFSPTKQSKTQILGYLLRQDCHAALGTSAERRLAMTMTYFLFSSERRGADRAQAPSSPHKIGEVLGDSFVSGDPVNGTMHGLAVVIARMSNHAIINHPSHAIANAPIAIGSPISKPSNCNRQNFSAILISFRNCLNLFFAFPCILGFACATRYV